MIQMTARGPRLVLEGALTMQTVDTVRATLREAIEALSDTPATGVVVDCAAATDIDLTFIQLLIASRTSADRLGKSVAVANPPEGALLDTLARGGFQIVPESGDAFWFESAAAA